MRFGIAASADGSTLWTVDAGNNAVLCIGRYFEGDKFFGVFNFSEHDCVAYLHQDDGNYQDLVTGKTIQATEIPLPAYGFYWLKKM